MQTGPTIAAMEAGAAAPRRDLAKGVLAAGGVLGAILASSCCIVPLLFVGLGIGGAWLGNLTALEPYKPYFVAGTLVFLGLGYWRVYGKPASVCKPDAYCANPVSSRVTRIALWFASALVLLAMTVSYWAPLFY